MDIDFDDLVEAALDEDLGTIGDITTDGMFDSETDVYILKSKDTGVLCGIEIFSGVFKKVDSSLNIKTFYKDGDSIKNGDIVAEISGKTSSILKGERTALNFLCHLSGISTKTALFVKAAGSIKILDTRKTIPGLRLLQKYAVKIGGGVNHRIGLYDMIMIKDNHIDGCGSITAAVSRVREKWGTRFKIEVETRTLDEVMEAVDCHVDRIMLDNMDNETMSKAVSIIAGRAETEGSGNMTLERLKSLGSTGVDFVSFGELTHTVKVFDFSLVKKMNNMEQ